MFTGIIEDVGRVIEVRAGAEGFRLKLNTALPIGEFHLGDSVAVDGACLTVAELGADWFEVDVSHETRAATSLGLKRAGQRVHLERALALGARLGGHLVTGHVDGVGRLLRQNRQASAVDLEIEAPAEVASFLVSKGSVAVDGVSLTVNRPEGGRFQVTLVPHTLKHTKLADGRPGDPVNLESDILGKYVRHFVMPGGGSGIDEKFLAEHGFPI